LLRLEVALLDALGELDLLLCREQGVAGRLVEEELEAVGRRLGELVRLAAPARAGRSALQRVLTALAMRVGALAHSAPGPWHVPPIVAHYFSKDSERLFVVQPCLDRAPRARGQTAVPAPGAAFLRAAIQRPGSG